MSARFAVHSGLGRFADAVRAFGGLVARRKTLNPTFNSNPLSGKR